MYGKKVGIASAHPHCRHAAAGSRTPCFAWDGYPDRSDSTRQSLYVAERRIHLHGTCARSPLEAEVVDRRPERRVGALAALPPVQSLHAEQPEEEGRQHASVSHRRPHQDVIVDRVFHHHEGAAHRERGVRPEVLQHHHEVHHNRNSTRPQSAGVCRFLRKDHLGVCYALEYAALKLR